MPFQTGGIGRRAIAKRGGTILETLPTTESSKTLESAEKKRLAAPKPSKEGLSSINANSCAGITCSARTDMLTTVTLWGRCPSLDMTQPCAIELQGEE